MNKNFLSWLFPAFFQKFSYFPDFPDPLTNSLTFPDFPDRVETLNAQKTNLQQFFLRRWNFSMKLDYTREMYLKKFKESNIAKVSISKLLLACNLLNMDAYSNDDQKIFLAKKLCDCNHVRSNQIAGSVNALKHFHF